jgi:hypothetical protein
MPTTAGIEPPFPARHVGVYSLAPAPLRISILSLPSRQA